MTLNQEYSSAHVRKRKTSYRL